MMRLPGYRREASANITARFQHQTETNTWVIQSRHGRQLLLFFFFSPPTIWSFLKLHQLRGRQHSEALWKPYFPPKHHATIKRPPSPFFSSLPGFGYHMRFWGPQKSQTDLEARLQAKTASRELIHNDSAIHIIWFCHPYHSESII